MLSLSWLLSLITTTVAIAIGAGSLDAANLGTRAVSAVKLGARHVWPDMATVPAAIVYDITVAAGETHTPPVSGAVNFVADWGDGSTDTITASGQAELTHTFATAGTYTVELAGSIAAFAFNNSGDRLQPVLIRRIGNVGLTTFANMWRGCSNLGASATHVLADTTNVTNMSGMFRQASAFNQPLPFDTTNVTNMSSMFQQASAFNQPLPFDTTNVTNMSSMFRQASAFNQPLPFDTTNVTNMSSMFRQASAFNQPLTFDTTNVTNMSGMFWLASAFNQPLTFDTTNVTNMSSMFRQASAFNQPLTFDTTNVTNMLDMFRQASAFNQPLTFDTTNVTNMSSMFRQASVFNQPLTFDTTNVTNMSSMFQQASAFNDSGVVSWVTSSLQNAASMFDGATLFSQNLFGWDVSGVTNASLMLQGTTLATPHYDAMLTSWSAQAVQPGVVFSGGNAKYSATTQPARDTLTNAPNNWVITDGGPA